MHAYEVFMHFLYLTTRLNGVLVCIPTDEDLIEDAKTVWWMLHGEPPLDSIEP